MDAGSSPGARKGRGWPKELIGADGYGHEHDMTLRTRFREVSLGLVEAAV